MATVISEWRWQPALEHPSLADGEVHVWRVSLAQPAAVVAQLALMLSTEEQQRAQRFHFERHRERFVVGRGLLRQLLAQYLDCTPPQVRLAYGAHGKPYLPDGTLHFNLAHTSDLALFVFARGRDVGVDVEVVQAMRDAEQIATRIMSAHELATWRAQPTSRQAHAFFECWTRKEAYIKALGDGLSLPLDQLDVDAPPAGWTLTSFVPARDHLAALAVAGEHATLVGYEVAQSFVIA